MGRQLPIGKDGTRSFARRVNLKRIPNCEPEFRSSRIYTDARQAQCCLRC